jgi:hypothetical protein
MNIFFNLNWDYKNERLFNPFTFNFSTTLHKDFAQINTEINYQITYTHPGQGLDFRAYFGGFLYNNSNLPTYNISISGNDGLSDYQYDDFFLGRTEMYGNHDFLSQQFSESGGNLSVYTPFSTNKWLCALNLKSTTIPILPIKVYFNIVNYNYQTYKNKNGKFINTGIKNNTLWDSGVEINLFSNLVSIYLPIAYSDEIRNVNNYFVNNYAERIRFVLRLNNLNFFKTIKEKETL